MSFREMRVLILMFFLLFGVGINTGYGFVYYSRVNGGNWSNPATWSTDAVLQCTGASAGSVPGPADDVFICSGFTVIFNTGVGPVTISNLTVRGTLTITDNKNLVCNSLALYGVIGGAGTFDLQIGNTTGSTLSGTGFFSMTNANLMLLSDVSIPNTIDYITLDNTGKLDLSGKTLTNLGRIDILDPSDFIGGGLSSFVNGGSSAYLKYTTQTGFPNILTATAIGNTVEFGATAGGPYVIGNAANYHHMIISGAAVKSLGVVTNIAGNLTINNGATLNSNTNNITIGGNWINNLGGSFIEGTRIVTFNGNLNNQTISVPAIAAGETFYNLIINNTFVGGTVTASGNITITSGQTLTMTSGIFDMGTNTLGETAAGARYTSTGGELRLAKLTTLPELTGSYTLTGGTTTFNGAGAQIIRGGVTYFSVGVNSSGGSGSKTLGGIVTISGNLTIGAGSLDVSASNFGITINGNWTNTGTFVPGTGTVTVNGSAAQTFTHTSTETFHNLILNAGGPLTLGGATDMIVTNTLTMTTGNFDLGGRTLTLGNSSIATLVRTAGIMYGGTFKRFVASGTAISSTVAPLYGLFPMGISTAYRPVEINSTVNPTSSGYIAVSHTDGVSKIDLSPTYNDGGTTMTRIHSMQSSVATSGGFAGGTYNINVTMTAFVNSGVTTDERLLIYTGGTTASSVGTHFATAGTVNSPVGKRTGLSDVNLTNLFVIGTSNAVATPLGPDNFYSRVVTGNWNTPATWSQDPVLQCTGAASTIVPRSTDNVIICAGTTITYNVVATTTIKDLTVESGGVLTVTASQTLNCNSLVLNGTINGGGNNDVIIGNAAGSTLSGGNTAGPTTGVFAKTSGNLTLLSNVSVPNATNYITFNNSSNLNLNGRILTNNGRVDILEPAGFSGGIGSSFVNQGYLKYTRAVNFPNNILTATATGNTVEYGHTNALSNTGTYYNVIFNRSGNTFTLATNPTNILGDLTIENGTTLAAGTRDINIAGNWNNNLGGTFTPGTRNVTFNGSLNSQTISVPVGGQAFADLTINNTFSGGTVTPSGQVTVNNGRTLTMTSGILNMGTNILTQTSGNANLAATGGDLRLAETGITLPRLTGTYSVTGGTITFNGAGNQTIRSLNATPSAYYNIVIANAGNKSLAGSIQVQGNWTNNAATFVPGTNTVTFNGTVLQTITASSETFYNLVCNTTGPLTQGLTTDVTITNQLTLTNGLININGRTLTLGSSGVASTLSRTASATTNWLYGGTFMRFWLTATAISSTIAPFYGLFPMGPSSGSNYRPVEINTTVSPTGGGSFTVKHIDATNIVTLSPVYNDAGTNILAVQNAQFITAISGVTGGTYDINATMTGLAPGTLSDIRLAVFTGGTTASAVGTHAVATGTAQNPTAKRTGITILTDLNNDFRIATTNIGATPLPVELTSFTAEFLGGFVTLNWETESELNSDFFVVQKTSDGERFTDVVKVGAAGTSTRPKAYGAVDGMTLPGKWYYRLKQTDYDGSYTYSKLIAVNVPESMARTVYPNPTDGTSFSVNFSQSDLGKRAVILVHDIRGAEQVHIVIDNLSNTQIQIDPAQQLSAGFYVISLGVEQAVVRQKLVVR